MIVLAPTGIAAINAGGVTIHSFFQVPFAPYVPESSFSADGKASYRFRYGKEKINIIRSIDLLVIDEISMVRADLLDSVDAVLRRFRDRNKPFGGVQLLMIGDLQQLAPVVKDDEWQMLRKYYDTPYFFSSQALKQTEYCTIELKIWGIERSVFSMVGKNGQKVLKTKGFRHGRENGLNISKRFFSLHGLTSALRLRGFSSDIRGIALHRACRWG